MSVEAQELRVQSPAPSMSSICKKKNQGHYRSKLKGSVCNRQRRQCHRSPKKTLAPNVGRSSKAPCPVSRPPKEIDAMWKISRSSVGQNHILRVRTPIGPDLKRETGSHIFAMSAQMSSLRNFKIFKPLKNWTHEKDVFVFHVHEICVPALQIDQFGSTFWGSSCATNQLNPVEICRFAKLQHEMNFCTTNYLFYGHNCDELYITFVFDCQN